jgi:hypothetical protein
LAQNHSAQCVLAQIAHAKTPRNTLRTPGFSNVDRTIAKNIAIKEPYSVKLRADMFIPGNPLFGRWDQVFSRNSRVVRITAKFLF